VTVSIRVATSPGEARIAVVEHNRLLDFSLWRPGAPDGVGDVHRGRVIAALPAMAGAFVALTDGEGFLPDSAGAKGLTAGTILTVRVTRAAQGSKGPRLTARGEQPQPNGPVALLRRGPDPIARLAARYPHAPIVVDDPAVAASLQRSIRRSADVEHPPPGVTSPPSILSNRDVTVNSDAIFDEDVAEAIDALSRPVVELPGGARVSIWPTPALVAIDVDAGGALAGSATGSAHARPRHETLNRTVVPFIAEQIRLRNLSGGIVVDLAGLSPRGRAALAPDLIATLTNDPLNPKFLGFTALGLAEIVRPRVHPPLHELLSGPLAAGLAALRAVVASSGQDPRGMPAVRANPAVVSALQADRVALPDLVRRTGRELTLRSDPSLPTTVWLLEKDHG
jgi:Ribonuclease G/E